MADDAAAATAAAHLSSEEVMDVSTPSAGAGAAASAVAGDVPATEEFVESLTLALAPSDGAYYFNEDKKHPLARTWTYWEKRAANDRYFDRKDWGQMNTDLCTFSTIEDFIVFWKDAPQMSKTFDFHNKDGLMVVRKDLNYRTGVEEELRTKTEGYAVFEHGIKPLTEFEIDGVRVTKTRRRSELSIRMRDMEDFDKAWLVIILALVGESLDPYNDVVGAFLTNKKAKGTASLRLELWFRTDNDAICNSISQALDHILCDNFRQLPFHFTKPTYELKRDGDIPATVRHPPRDDSTPSAGAGRDRRDGGRDGRDGRGDRRDRRDGDRDGDRDGRRDGGDRRDRRDGDRDGGRGDRRDGGRDRRDGGRGGDRDGPRREGGGGGGWSDRRGPRDDEWSKGPRR